jgi:hypothetical protein
MRFDFKTRIEAEAQSYKDSYKIFGINPNNQIEDISIHAVIHWYVGIDARESGIKSIDTFIRDILIYGNVTYIDGGGEAESIDFEFKIPKSWIILDEIEQTSNSLYLSMVIVNFDKKEIIIS